MDGGGSGGGGSGGGSGHLGLHLAFLMSLDPGQCWHTLLLSCGGGMGRVGRRIMVLVVLA